MFIPAPGSDFSIPDRGSWVKKIPDPHPHQSIYVFLTQKLFINSRKVIWDVHPGSQIQIFSPPGSGYRIRNTAGNLEGRKFST
jgi:hypothetical protein